MYIVPIRCDTAPLTTGDASRPFPDLARARLSTIVWTAGIAILGAYAYLVAAGRMTHGFIAYYAASRALLAGRFGAWVYDEPSFTAYVQELTGTGVLEIFGPNPPSMSLLLLPLAALDPATARAVWLVLSLAAWGWASAVLARRMSPRSMGSATVAVALMLLSPAVFANIRNAQAYLVIAAAQVAAAHFILRRRDGTAGTLLGASVAVKTSGVPLLLVIAFAKRRRALVTALAMGAACVAVTIAVTGIEPWMRYPGYVAEFVGQPRAAVTAYQTTASLFHRLCIADPAWNPAAAADCSTLGRAMPALLEVAAVLITLRVVAGAPAALWLAAGGCLSVLLLPIAEDHQFVLLALPMMLLVESRRQSGHDRVFTWAFVAFSVLLLVPLENTAYRFTAGWGVLLAYPRLYAAWLLWALVIREIRRHPPDGNSVTRPGETRVHASS